MHDFIAKHRDKITGTLSGFDRLVFRGTLRSLSFADGMRHHLHAAGVLLKDFGSYVKRVSGQLKEAALEQATRLGRPMEYLASSKESKEDIARKIAARDDIREGLVCVLTAVEPCWSFEIHRNREMKKLELKSRYPELHLQLLCHAGDRLSDHDQDVGSYRYAIVNSSAPDHARLRQELDEIRGELERRFALREGTAARQQY